MVDDVVVLQYNWAARPCAVSLGGCSPQAICEWRREVNDYEITVNDVGTPL